MKKQVITLAIILGLSMTGFAQGGSMFHRENSGDNGNAVYQDRSSSNIFKDGNMPGLPGHGGSGNENAPLGSGVVMLLGLGAAYAVAKKRNEE